MLNSALLPEILSTPSNSPKSNFNKSKFTKENIFIQTKNFLPDSLPAWSFTTDTRNVPENSWFIALKGQSFDGHAFCEQAIANGAKGLIISDLEVFEKIAGGNNSHISIILVADTLKAYQLIAQHHRRELSPITIAITGSNGKTTTRQILTRVLSVKYKVHSSEGNENNEIGVPKTILKLQPEHEIAILEFGMRGLNQIEELTLIAEPDYACITNIGTAHIGILGSREKIAEAKSEIFRSLINNEKAQKKAWIPTNESLLKSWIENACKSITFEYFGKFQNATFKEGLMSFEYKNSLFYFKSPNTALISGVCLVIDIAHELGLTDSQIQQGLNQFSLTPGRGAIHHLPSGALLIDETYNASPDSVLALAESINCLAKQESQTEQKYKILILGEMAELGDFKGELLGKVASKISELIDTIILIGKGLECLEEKINSSQTKKAINFDSIEKAYEFLFSEKENYLNSNSIIGIKASRIAKLERLVNLLILENS